MEQQLCGISWGFSNSIWWKYLKGVWKWHLGIWFNGEHFCVGLCLYSVILGLFSKLYDSGILYLAGAPELCLRETLWWTQSLLHQQCLKIKFSFQHSMKFTAIGGKKPKWLKNLRKKFTWKSVNVRSWYSVQLDKLPIL